MAHTDTDTLVLDLSAANRLARIMDAAAGELIRDQFVLYPLLDDATTMLHREQTGTVASVESARRRVADLAGDLFGRLALIDSTRLEIARVDALGVAMLRWTGHLDDPVRAAMGRERQELVLALVGGDRSLAVRVERLLASGSSVGTALATVHAEVRYAARVSALAAELGIGSSAAEVIVRRVDRNLAELDRLGFGLVESQGAVAIVEQFDLDLSVALARTAVSGTGLLGALGDMLLANALGITLEGFDALDGLDRYFAFFDNVSGGRADGLVSARDLEYVVDHERRFTSGQVMAAQALLDAPQLWNRIDTALENGDIISGERFGRTEPGDGLISEADLQAFMSKAQVRHLLGDYADRIDIAADPSGQVDGVYSENDLRAFLTDDADLPESVRATAELMLDNGWFDESWWQEHKDELAMGAALVGAGIVVVVTGGSASLLLVAGTGALSAGATTVAVNLRTGDDGFDDVAINGLRGLFVGLGVHGAVVGSSAYVAATSTLGRSAAVAGISGGVTDVVSAGGIDLVIPEQHEALVHDTSDVINMVATGWELSVDGGWILSRATFGTLEEQLEALRTTVSRQRQNRHVRNMPGWPEGGYLEEFSDAQVVLDAVHDKSADILGRTTNGHILVRLDDVEGINVNLRSANPEQLTNMFLIKGTSSPSVVPTSPGATPREPRWSTE